MRASKSSTPQRLWLGLLAGALALSLWLSGGLRPSAAQTAVHHPDAGLQLADPGGSSGTGG